MKTCYPGHTDWNTTKFRLLIPYHKLSGNMNLREVPCSPATTLDGLEQVSVLKEMNGAVSLPQPSV